MQIDSHVNHMGMGTEVPIDIVLGGVSKITSLEIQESRNSLPNVSLKILAHMKLVLPGEDSGLQFSCMSLHLIPMLIRTPKEVSTAVHIKHDSPSGIISLLPLLMICSHLYPF